MFSPEFDQLYREAFESSIGRSFDDPLMQEWYAINTTNTVNALLEHWTDPDAAIAEPITDTFTTRRANLFRIKHPATPEFTEEDAEDIAKIRFFGRATIIAAEASLSVNPVYDGRPEFFNANLWYSYHRDVDPESDAPAHDPNAASPTRLAHWPQGKYLNCLGIAIATAADSKMNPDMDYVFMNRIRHAQLEINVSWQNIRERIAALSPYAETAEFILHLADAMKAKTDPEETDCIYANGDSRLVHNNAPDTSFHHAVIRRDRTKDEFLKTGWTQYDPYALVEGEISNFPLARKAAELFETMSDGTCNEVLLIDSDYIDESYKYAGGAVSVARRLQGRLIDVLSKYSRTDYLRIVREEVALQKSAVTDITTNREDLSEISIAELVENVGYRIPATDPSMAYAWLVILSTAAFHTSRFRDNIQVEEIFTHKYAQKNGADVEDLIKIIEGLIGPHFKTDRELQHNFWSIVLAMPYAYCLKRLESVVKMQSLDNGTSDQTMEVGDPAFMIGAMYLNHYARWSNGGKVNAAKEMARLTPSQIIWQAAVVHDAQAADDPRVHVVGDLIRGLKIDQQHPLVRITTHLRR